MGTWGAGIFQNDVALYTRDTFRDAVKWGDTLDEATRIVLQHFGEDDADALLALAVTQWRSGWLLDLVKAKALGVIDLGEDLRARWSDDAKLAKSRAAALAKTRALLESPQPPAKPLPKPKPYFKETTDWEVGDVLSHQLTSGDYLVLRAVGHHVSRTGRRVIAEMLDYAAATPPTFEAVRALKVRVLFERWGWHYRPHSRLLLFAKSEQQLPDLKRWVRLGSVERASVPDAISGEEPVEVRWDTVAEQLSQLVSCRPGPGGDEHQTWQVGDVLAYQRPSGQYLLFHFVDRLVCGEITGAPVVTTFDWNEASLPTEADIAFGALVPMAAAPLWNTLEAGRCLPHALAHSDEDGVSPNAVKRIGNFQRNYDCVDWPLRGQSIRMLIDQYDSDRSWAQRYASRRRSPS